MYLDKTVFVEIFTPYALNGSSNGNNEMYTAHSGFAGLNGPTNAIQMNIQPMSPQMTLVVGGEIGKTFLGFTSASGLIESMRVTVSGTNQQYIVKGRQNYDYGPMTHNEVTLFRRDPTNGV